MAIGNFKLWNCGKERFAVTRPHEVAPLLGYVTRHARRSWRIERAGKILHASYPSADDAANALIELVSFRSGPPPEDTSSLAARA